MPNKIKLLQQDILNWYQRHGRDLPWRHTTDPYAILVSEIMLQQTQVDRVIPKYLAWLSQFPSASDLAASSTASAIEAWSGLGYNRRALYLKQTAAKVAAGFPRSEEELKKLPGIGPYTAAAITSFAYNANTPLVDTNIKRIYQLLVFGDQHDPTQAELYAIARKYLPENHSKEWHNALMDIGAAIAKIKGARGQQEKLVELFPSLLDFPLPSVTDASLKRPKQLSFLQSKRYWRGKIVRILLAHKKISIKRLKQILTKYDEPCPYDIDELIRGLATDHLLEVRRESIFLPR